MHDLLGLELIVILGVAVLVCGVAARRFRVAPPVLLLVFGIALGFLAFLREVHLPPETVLLIFLPALLHWESITTSLRDIRRDLRGIMLTGTVLVVLAAAAVATTAHALGVGWGPAWVLGAALAPTDATAVGALARSLPRRNVALLRAESLINDGTALVVYGLAVGVVVGAERLSVVHVSGLLVLSYTGGIVAGAVTTWVAVRVWRHLDDPLQEILVGVLAPFTAFLLAELIHGSGVLAVVVSGLLMAQAAPRVARADARQQAWAFWALSTYMLNGALFVLMGIEVQDAVRGLSSAALLRGLGTVAAVSIVLFVVRVAFLFTAAYTIRLLDRRPEQQQRRVTNRARIVSGTAGFRGAVSLAAALAVPQTLDTGAAFPDRGAIIFITAGVVFVTITLQGLLLPGVVRWARTPRDDTAADERRLAERLTLEEGLAALPGLADELGTDPQLADRLRLEYETHLSNLETQPGTDGAPHRHENDRELRLAVLSQKRSTLIRLRDENRIDDAVLRELQTQLDIEEVRMSRRESGE